MKPTKQSQALQIIAVDLPKAIRTLGDYDTTMRAMKAAWGFEEWARQAKDIELLEKAIEVKWNGQRLVGQYLIDTAKKGLRYTGRPRKGQKIGTPSDPNLMTLEEMGIERKQSQDWQQKAKWSEPEFRKKLRWEQGWYTALVSRDTKGIKKFRELRNAAKREHRKVREERLATEIRLKPGSPRFGVVVANVPWERAGFAAKKKNAKVVDVETLDEQFIKLAPNIETIVADDCVLGLWCSEPWRGERVLRAWGFEPKASFIWVKNVVPDDKKYGPKMMMKKGDKLTVVGEAGTGYWNRDRAEQLLIGTRGRPVAPAPGEQGERVWFAAKPPGDKGEKPPICMEWFEQQFPTTPKVEIFARNYRKGWSSHGKDLPDGPRGLDDAANEAHRMPQILSKDEKTPFDDDEEGDAAA